MDAWPGRTFEALKIAARDASMAPMSMLSIINPSTLLSYPATLAGPSHRLCYAIPAGARFAVVVKAPRAAQRFEAVVAVDGRDTLSNRDAAPGLPGIVFTDRYTCLGFRTDAASVREFICTKLGSGATTAERNGTAASAGTVAAALYPERGYRYSSEIVGQPIEKMSGDHYRGGPIARSLGGDRGASVGAAAGAAVSSRIGETRWERNAAPPEIEIIEYDTVEGWLARGVAFQVVGLANPWPGDVGSGFARPESL